MDYRICNMRTWSFLCVRIHTGLGTQTASQHNSFDLEKVSQIVLGLLIGSNLRLSNVESNALPIDPSHHPFSVYKKTTHERWTFHQSIQWFWPIRTVCISYSNMPLPDLQYDHRASTAGVSISMHPQASVLAGGDYGGQEACRQPGELWWTAAFVRGTGVSIGVFGKKKKVDLFFVLCVDWPDCSKFTLLLSLRKARGKVGEGLVLACWLCGLPSVHLYVSESDGEGEDGSEAGVQRPAAPAAGEHRWLWGEWRPRPALCLRDLSLQSVDYIYIYIDTCSFVYLWDLFETCIVCVHCYCVSFVLVSYQFFILSPENWFIQSFTLFLFVLFCCEWIIPSFWFYIKKKISFILLWLIQFYANLNCSSMCVCTVMVVLIFCSFVHTFFMC